MEPGRGIVISGVALHSLGGFTMAGPAQASDYVVLEIVSGLAGGFGPSQIGFVRNMPDGSSIGNWSVPPNSALVITEADWQYISPSGTPGMQILRLWSWSPGSPGPGPAPGPVRQARVFESAIILDQNGEGGGTFAMNTGFVVTGTGWIGVDMMPGPLGPPSGLQHLLLRGYLIPAGTTQRRRTPRARRAEAR